jgi:hypothetical protein
MKYIDAIRYRSARAMRRALLRIVGAVLLAIGAGFLTAALWIMLEEVYSAMAAAFILAAIYVGIGLFLLGVAASAAIREARIARAEALRAAAAPPGARAMPPLAEAFLTGLNAALAARGRGPTPPPRP